MNEPSLKVGIINESKIEFILHSEYIINGMPVTGYQTATYDNSQINWLGSCYDELIFTPINHDKGFFEIINVTIGIDFHWQRKENQSFAGEFKIIIDQQLLVGINIIPLEDYLTSVVSSEMSATASLSLLKAHAVISRSWLLAQLLKEKNICCDGIKDIPKTDAEHIVWYDREDHQLFDVCADDHCQRYQGITKASTALVREAIAETRGEALIFDGEICDARYSKCCGGMLEEFSSCWEDKNMHYLSAKRDIAQDEVTKLHLDNETDATNWIKSSPPAFCNTQDPAILRQVLNNYDQETRDFYRWSVTYTQHQLKEIIMMRSNIDFGDIIDLIPIKRGKSARIILLKIVGSKRTVTIGKELEIRRILSATHLYSSAFVIEKEYADNSKKPLKFILRGAGWGHGVGLCQIGAAVMGEKGYSYKQILTHYYTDCQITSLY